ncbi:ribosomal protein L7/L12 [Actinocorallia longicatena]|uniref:Large ribosomal subunit protein bL12 C-terminal domain-containing protein n=1 Tax=Actinocorallia longicatena TaxID=111803 RepID=A0ABP6QPI3_9ACTN
MKFGSTPPPPPIVLPDHVIAEVRHLLAARKKIQAIKLIREVTGSGLKEAKDLADAMEGGYLPPTPQQFHAPPQPNYAQPSFPQPSFPQPSYPQAAQASLADRARAFRDSGDPERAVALIQAETGMTREESARFLGVLG